MWYKSNQHIYFLKVNNGNIRIMCEIFLKLTTKIPQ